MRMGECFMPMGVTVGFWLNHVRTMNMLMMFIMDVSMRVFDIIMRMVMNMALRQMKPCTKGHEQAREDQ